ncbi:hypothetical protein IX325_000703 [Fusobacterium necrophorum subsp. funduliforme]|uniref:hypothetical protein n=1 Tax=Fusobacterium necrophorum TaxID=859 RepID=UPI001B8BEA08|nr:hypothetical protein [Fusobacterium necrophorum]MBR8722395.1 hypothetical protein [Fusobacterium necrophorum subsp. funduliforme]
MKKLQKIIFFTKKPIATNQKFYEDLGERIGLKLIGKIEKHNREIEIEQNIGMKIEISTDSSRLENDNYVLIINDNRIEFSTKKDSSIENFKEFKNLFISIIDFLKEAYQEIYRVGYIIYNFEDCDKSISEFLKIPFLKNANEINIKYNNIEELEGYRFNNNITISSRFNNEKVFLILQDFNFVVNKKLVLEKDIIEKIYDYLEENYYNQEIKKYIGIEES